MTSWCKIKDKSSGLQPSFLLVATHSRLFSIWLWIHAVHRSVKKKVTPGAWIWNSCQERQNKRNSWKWQPPTSVHHTDYFQKYLLDMLFMAVYILRLFLVWCTKCGLKLICLSSIACRYVLNHYSAITLAFGSLSNCIHRKTQHYPWECKDIFWFFFFFEPVK